MTNAQNPAPAPVLGDTVHYVSYGTPQGEFTSQCRAAIVTAERTSAGLSIAVLNPTGLFFQTATRYANPRTTQGPSLGGSWHTREECPRGN